MTNTTGDAGAAGDQAGTQLSDAVSMQVIDDVAVVNFDDGKANVISFDAVSGMHAALDAATDAAKAVVIVGRDGKFSAGFDLPVMTGDDRDQAKELFGRGAGLCHRLYVHPQPVIAACTGHALALGAIALMSCDVRYGADGPYKLGMTEVAIGMALPTFAVELARERLSKRHFQVATQHARAYGPAGARDAGYLDEVLASDDVVPHALAYATEMAATLHPGAFAATRKNVRAASARTVAACIEADIAGFG